MKRISNCCILSSSLFFVLTVFYVLPAAHSEEEDLGLSLSALLNLDVEVASLFKEDELSAGSTVSAITPSQWTKMGSKRTHDALENELSVMSYHTLGGSPAIAIRGYTSKSGSVRGIAVMLDGVPTNMMEYGTSFYMMPNWDLGTLERIEMIRGPGSAIYGSDAFHGVIAYQTFASDEDHYSAKASCASNKYYSGELKMSQGFADGKFRIDFAGAGSTQGDQDIEYFHANDATSPGPGADKRDYASGTGVLKFRAYPTDRLNITLGIYAGTWESDAYQGLGNSYNALDDGYDNGESDSEFFMARALFSYDLGKTKTLELDLYQSENEYDLSLNHTSVVVGGNLAALMLLEGGDDAFRRGAKLTLKQETNDMNLQWLLSCAAERIENTNSFNKLTNTISGAVLLDQPTNYDKYDRNISSILGQAKWSIADAYHLLLSARFDHYSDVGNEFTPRCGLIVNPSETSAVKLLYGRAFRAPTPSELKGSAAAEGDMNMESEIIDNFELGYIFKQENYKINLTAFYSKWKEGISAYTDATSSTGIRYKNEGKNEAYGLESQLIMGLDPFTFHVGLGYVKSTALDAENPVNPANTKDRDYAAFPKISFITGMEYHMKDPDIFFYINNRIYSGWNEALWDDNANADNLDTYWRTDINISKTFSHLKVNLNIKNIFDRENYKPTIFRAVEGNEEEGISAMLSVSYDFLWPF